MTKLYERFQEAIKANNNDYYTTISVRSPIEMASMIETISIVTQQPVVNMFTTDLSGYLAGYLLENKDNINLITQILNEEYGNHDRKIEDFIQGSCIEALKNDGYLNVKITPDFEAISKEMEELDITPKAE